MQIGKPASPDELVDRENEVNEVITKIRSKINYNIAVTGHRRIGKSSILVKIADILSNDNKTVVVYFDVKKNLGDPKSFLINLQSAIFNAYLKKLGKLGQLKARAGRSFNFMNKIAEALSAKKIKGIGLEIKPGISPDDFSIVPKLEFAAKIIDYMPMFESVFKTVNAFAEKDNMKFVIILDEFQDIVQLHRYKGLKNILNLFRGIIQERGKNVSYVVCGSHVHLLRTILSSGKSPLFQHFIELPVDELDKKNSMVLFNEYLDARGLKANNNAAIDAFDLVGGQPFYLMALAEKWIPAKKMTDVFNELLLSSLGSLRLYAEYVLTEDIATAQGGPVLKSILIKMATSNKAGLSYSEISRLLGMPMTSLVPYVNELIKMDLVVKEENLYKIRDKIIYEYLRLNFSSNNI